MEKNQKMDEGKMASDNDEMKTETRPRRYGANWIVGVVFILAGAAILLGNFTGFRLNNWWALFILIPAAGAWANTYRAYKNAGNRFDASARGSLIGGLTISLVAAIFLFNLNWGLMWPAMLVIIGAGILFSSLGR